MEGKCMEGRWLVGDNRWLCREAPGQLQIRARVMGPCERGDNAPSVPAPGALTLLEAKWCHSCPCRTSRASVVLPGPSPPHPAPVPAGVATSICGFYCIYLFTWLISSGSHSQARCVPSLSLLKERNLPIFITLSSEWCYFKIS